MHRNPSNPASFEQRVADADVVADAVAVADAGASFDEEETHGLVRTKSNSRSVSPVQIISRGGGMSSKDRLKIGFYFALWYFLNVIYNSKSMRRALCKCPILYARIISDN